MNLQELLDAAGIQVKIETAQSATPISAVVADSRAVTAGTLFVAIPGLRVDGHRFIPAVMAAGAVAVVGTHSSAALEALEIPLPLPMPYIQVADSREALAHLNAALHSFPSRVMSVIGVTGTDGKTTTCTLIESILSAAQVEGGVGVITTIGARINGEEQDTGFHVTTPDAPAVQRYLAQMRDAGCRYAVVESTSHGLDQRRVAAVEYDVAAVTNITHEHLDYHGSYEAYRAAKALLFRALFQTSAKNGVPRVAILNADDEGSYAALQTGLAEEKSAAPGSSVQIRSYSIQSQDADLYAANIAYQPAATRFDLHWWNGVFPIETRLIGEFNVANILCAAAVALSLGVPPEGVQAGIAALPGVLGRMQRMDGGQDFLAIVDFAHSPVSLERALKTLRPLVAPGGRLIAIFGSAGLRDRAKRRLMGQVSGRLADYTIITAEDPRTEDVDAINREIAAGVEESAPSTAYHIVPDRGEAIWQGIALARPGDVVASFGKGHERSMCFGETEYPWSDQAAMVEALEKRGLGTGDQGLGIRDWAKR
jgi:UDP-N-acetylmuramoyl-L-alanyl-D-glutamate--2,6-diaminopimelate ligase